MSYQQTKPHGCGPAHRLWSSSGRRPRRHRRRGPRRRPRRHARQRRPRRRRSRPGHRMEPRPARDPQHARAPSRRRSMRPAAWRSCTPRSTTPSTRSSGRPRRTSSRSGHRVAQTRQQPRPPPATRCCRASTRASRSRSARSSTRCSRRSRTGTTSTKASAIGQAVADALLALRADDGSSAAPPVFTPGTQPGDYQPTPPAFAQPAFTHWPRSPVRAAQRKPVPARPAAGLTSTAYTAAFKEVQSLGAITSTTRTADQTQIAQFWNPPIWIAWNNIAQTAALAHHDTLMQNARLFALLNLSFADSVIAFYDAKYTYHFWRPVTAIRAADTTAIRPPQRSQLAAAGTTAQDPSYPGAHAVISAAGADVLATSSVATFAFSAQSTALPGVDARSRASAPRRTRPRSAASTPASTSAPTKSLARPSATRSPTTSCRSSCSRPRPATARRTTGTHHPAREGLGALSRVRGLGSRVSGLGRDRIQPRLDPATGSPAPLMSEAGLRGHSGSLRCRDDLCRRAGLGV